MRERTEPCDVVFEVRLVRTSAVVDTERAELRTIMECDEHLAADDVRTEDRGLHGLCEHAEIDLDCIIVCSSAIRHVVRVTRSDIHLGWTVLCTHVQRVSVCSDDEVRTRQ